MWVFMNDSFLSIVEDKKDKNQLVVRARIYGDIEAFIEEYNEYYTVLETDDSDYRFRAFVPREVVAQKMYDRINSIDYLNFKNSCGMSRKQWYTRVWSVMFDVQEKIFGRSNWWINYRENIQGTSQRK
jgi:hypothetical protein